MKLSSDSGNRRSGLEGTGVSNRNRGIHFVSQDLAAEMRRAFWNRSIEKLPEKFDHGQLQI